MRLLFYDDKGKVGHVGSLPNPPGIARGFPAATLAEMGGEVRFSGWNPGEGVKAAARTGHRLAARLVWKEGIHRETFHVLIDKVEDFPAGAINGRSMELAFALHVLSGFLNPTVGHHAATGALSERAEVLCVEGVAAKLRAAVAKLPAGAVVFVPRDNACDVDAEMREAARQKQIELVPVSRLEEAASRLFGREFRQSWLGSPFRGLDRFTEADAAIYFGREAEAEELHEKFARALAECRGILVFAASGSGKSSLIRAGLLHRLKKRGPLDTVVFDMGDSTDLSEASLCGLLARALATWGRFASPAAVISLDDFAVDPDMGLPGAPLRLLIVDPFEDLFIRGYSRRTQLRFAAFLRRLLDAGVAVVAAMRGEYFKNLDELQDDGLPVLHEIFDLVPLSPLRPASLRSIVEGPAEVAELRFEIAADGESVADKVLRDFEGQADALPLLGFLMSELYEARDKERDLITFDAYHSTGGLRQVIDTRAAAVLDAQDEEGRAALPVVLRCLALSDPAGDSPTTPRTWMIGELPANVPERRLLAALAEARLVKLDVEAGYARAVLTHAAILVYWQAARDGIAQDLPLLRIRDRLAILAETWRADGRTPGRLLAALPDIRDAEDLMQTLRPQELVTAPVLAEFLAESFDRARRRRFARLRALAVGLALLAWASAEGAWYAWQQQQEAERQTAIAEARLAEVQVSESRFLAQAAAEATVKGDYDLALNLVREAMPTNPGAKGQRPVVEEAVIAGNGVFLHDARRGRLTLEWLSEDLRWFSPGGRYVLTVDMGMFAKKNVIRLRDVETGAVVAEQTGRPELIESFDFSPEGRLAWYRLENTAWILDRASGERLATLTQPDPIAEVISSRDGRQVATRSLNVVRVWNVATGEMTVILENPDVGILEKPGVGSFYSAAFSPDGRRLVTAALEAKARIWDTANGECLLTLPDVGLLHVATFSPDGRWIVTAHRGVVRIWDADSGKGVGELKGLEGDVWRVLYSPDGRWIVGSDNDKTIVWNAATGDILTSFAASSLAAFTEDGSRLLVEDGSQGILWDVEALAAQTGHRHKDRISRALFSPDGQRVISFDFGETGHLWEVATAETLGTLKAYDAVFSDDGRKIFAASADGVIRVFAADTDAPPFVVGPHSWRHDLAAFSSDGKRIVVVFGAEMQGWDVDTGAPLNVQNDSGRRDSPKAKELGGRLVSGVSRDKNTIRIWDVDAGRLEDQLPGRGEIHSTSLSTAGRRVLVAYADGEVRLWYLDGRSPPSTEIMTAQKDKFSNATISPDGKRAAILLSHRVFIHDGHSYKTQLQIWNEGSADVRTFTGAKGNVDSATFSPDGRRLLVASGDGNQKKMQIWDTDSGAVLAVLKGSPAALDRSSFSPDGRRILTADGNHVRVWNMEKVLSGADLPFYAAMTSLRGMTDLERARYFLPLRPSLDPCETELDTKKRLTLCEAAVSRFPQHPRFRYRLARVYDELGRREEAETAYQAARETSSVPAWGRLFPDDPEHFAETWPGLKVELERGAQAGNAAAEYVLAIALWNQPGPYRDRTAALTLAEKAATKGLPDAHDFLADRHALGVDTAKDLEKALFHRAVAARLYLAQGRYDEADVADAQRGTLARHMTVADVVRIGRAVEAWKQAN